jgi:hypothetical protein
VGSFGDVLGGWLPAECRLGVLFAAGSPLRGQCGHDADDGPHARAARSVVALRAVEHGAAGAPGVPVMAGTLFLLLAGQRPLLAKSAATLVHLHWVWVPVMLLGDYASRAAVARTHRQLLSAGGAAG